MPLAGEISSRGVCGKSTLVAGGVGVAGALGAMGIYIDFVESGILPLFAGTLSVPIVGAVGAVVGIAIYCWGDDIICWIFGCDEIDCNMVSNIHPFVLSCNSISMQAIGAGDDIISYEWDNVNAIPQNATTIILALTMSTVNPALPVTVRVIAVCQDGSEQDTYEETFNFSNIYNVPPSSISIVDGPSNANRNQTYRYSSSLGANGQYLLTWNTSFGGNISATGPYWANIPFWNIGVVTITATLTNQCTGNQFSTTYQVNVTR